MKKSVPIIVLLTAILSVLTLTACLRKIEMEPYEKYHYNLKNAIEKTAKKEIYQLALREETTVEKSNETTVKTLMAKNNGDVKKTDTIITDAQGDTTENVVYLMRRGKNYFISESVNGCPVIQSTDKKTYEKDRLIDHIRICDEINTEKDFLSVLNKGYASKNYNKTEDENGVITLSYYESNSSHYIDIVIKDGVITDVNAFYVRTETFDRKLSSYLSKEFDIKETTRKIRLTIHINYEAAEISLPEKVENSLSLLTDEEETYSSLDNTKYVVEELFGGIDVFSRNGRHLEKKEGNTTLVSDARDKVIRNVVYDGDTKVDEIFYYKNSDQYYRKRQITDFSEEIISREEYSAHLCETLNAFYNELCDVIPSKATKTTLILCQGILALQTTERWIFNDDFVDRLLILADSIDFTYDLQSNTIFNSLDTEIPLFSFRKYEDNALIEEAAAYAGDEVPFYYTRKKYENNEEKCVCDIKVYYFTDPIEIPEGEE